MNRPCTRDALHDVASGSETAFSEHEVKRGLERDAAADVEVVTRTFLSDPVKHKGSTRVVARIQRYILSRRSDKRLGYVGHSSGGGNRWDGYPVPCDVERLGIRGSSEDGERLSCSGREERTQRSMDGKLQADRVRNASSSDGGQIGMIAELVVIWLLRSLLVRL